MTEGRWRNPYRVGKPILDPQQFFGRGKELRVIFQRVHSGDCLSLVGERRSGKTSLLLHLQNSGVQAQHLPSQHNLLFIYLNAELTNTPADFFRHWFKPVAAQEPSLPVGDGGEIDYRQVQERLDRLAGRRRLVIMIDEFEKLVVNERFPLEFFDFLRGLIQSYDLSCLTATKTSLHACCPSHKTGSPFFNFFNPVLLGAFTPEEFDAFLTETSRPFGFPAPAHREAILDLAGRFPFFVQMACWHYFEAESAARCQPDTAVDPRQVRQAFAEEVARHFDYIWHHLSTEEPSNERQAVLTLARGEHPASMQTVRTLEQKGYVIDGRLFSSVFADLVREVAVKKGAMPLEATPPSPPTPPSKCRIWRDPDTKEVWVDGACIGILTKLQDRLFQLLYQTPNKVWDKYDIIDWVWGEPFIDVVDDPRVEKLMSRLRQKIERDPEHPRYIINVHGLGYKLAT